MISALLRPVMAGFFSLGAVAYAAGEPVKIVSAEFGVFDTRDPREVLFEPVRVVPHKAGQRYGWIIEVRTKKRSLSVREEYLLENPQVQSEVTDPIRQNLMLPLVRRNQVSQRQLVPVEGKIYGEWVIGPAEPAGRRHLQVLIEGQVAASFEYEVK